MLIFNVEQHTNSSPSNQRFEMTNAYYRGDAWKVTYNSMWLYNFVYNEYVEDRKRWLNIGRIEVSFRSNNNISSSISPMQRCIRCYTPDPVLHFTRISPMLLCSNVSEICKKERKMNGTKDGNHRMVFCELCGWTFQVLRNYSGQTTPISLARKLIKSDFLFGCCGEVRGGGL